MIPIDEITSRKSRTGNVRGRWFSRLKYTTKQPDMKAKSRKDTDVTKNQFGEIFRKWDKTGSGKMDLEKMKLVLEKIGVPADTIQVLMAQTPGISNGNMNY